MVKVHFTFDGNYPIVQYWIVGCSSPSLEYNSALKICKTEDPLVFSLFLYVFKGFHCILVVEEIQ